MKFSACLPPILANPPGSIVEAGADFVDLSFAVTAIPPIYFCAVTRSTFLFFLFFLILSFQVYIPAARLCVELSDSTASVWRAIISSSSVGRT